MDHFDVLIIGGGHGGAQAAGALRQGNFQGSIGILSAEPEFPYERPPLSKEYLAGDKTFDRLLIRPETFWTERDVVIRHGEKVTAVAPQRHQITTESGETIGYGKLIWAAGGEARRLSCAGGDLAGVHTVRTRADVDRIRSELTDVEQVVVIGGGYIGLEAAAALTKFGKRIVLLEALDRVLARVAGEPLSRFYESEHRAHGVVVRLDETVKTILGDGGRVTGVELVDGEIVPAQMVIVGIGIIPSVEPLLSAGADGGHGVQVDPQCRTSLADIFAVGDCALHGNRFANGAMIRLESVQNANDQATVAAKTILGENVSYDAVPWFWSNQYDLKLQTVGLSLGYDACVVRGEPASRSFSVIYLRAGQVIAIDAVNAVKDYVQGRKLVLDRLHIAGDALADTAVALKDLYTA